MLTPPRLAAKLIAESEIERLCAASYETIPTGANIPRNVALKRNAGFRRSLRLGEQLTQARYLAESGVEEALHSITVRNSLERKVDEGAIRATWKPVSGAAGQYDTISTGVFRAGELTSPAVTIRARVTLAEPGKTGAARIVSWQVERRGGASGL